jgi:hypothetical protein
MPHLSGDPQPFDEEYLVRLLTTLEQTPAAARALARILRLAERRPA